MKIPIYQFIIVFLIFASQSFGHGMSEAEKQVIVEGGNLQYVYIGMTHMLSGYDHLLFIFGMVFFLNKFKDVVKFITAFTLGHSITLILATFNALTINYFLIDAVIALSLCFIGIVNIIRKKKLFNINLSFLLFAIVLFGLIHGLGLSTRLQELPLDQEKLLLNIISFNIGIEFGQIVALTFMLVIIYLFRRSFIYGYLTYILNILIIIAGIYLFIFQINEYKSSKEVFDYKDKINITIPALTGKEYKIWIEKDKNIKYSWQTKNSEKIYYDFHGEPAADLTGYFKSYKVSTYFQDKGELTAPFIGTHGWYWENKTSKPIDIILLIKGDYKLIQKR